MSSYLKFYQEFLQKKEKSVSRSSSENQKKEKNNFQFEEETENSHKKCGSDNKMEHSYTRDSSRPCGEITGLTTRTLFVRRPPQCPSCHSHPTEESDLDDPNQPSVPSYNEIAAKDSMNECSRIAKSVKNVNSNEHDWEVAVNQNGWSKTQKQLFNKVARILDLDQLGRLANFARQTEAMQRRVLIDKSAKRFRKALASVSWDARLTQWLHGLLMDVLPPSYVASYLDILQTLKNKLPTLMDKMLFGRPMNVSQELLAPVLKKQWEPCIITNKQRKITQDAVMIALPSMPTNGPVPNRIQKWYQHLSTITQIVQISFPLGGSSLARQPLEQIAEQIVSLTRIKIQEIRNEQPCKAIILVGFNAGAAMALQVAMSEAISCVVCIGFAFNTLNGIRGTPDDRILDIKSPIMFVLGQNSARTSQEEVESLREKMQSETLLVVVGSADDVLRVPKSRRKIENITQSMVDVMIIDEVYDFLKKTLSNPPGPRIPTSITNPLLNIPGNSRKITGGDIQSNRKRKQSPNLDKQLPAKVKYGNAVGKILSAQIGRPRTRPYPPMSLVKSSPNVATSTPIAAKNQHADQKLHKLQTSDDLNSALQSILSVSSENTTSTLTDSQVDINSSTTDTGKLVTSFEIVAQSKSVPIKNAMLNSGIKGAFVGSSNVINTSTSATQKSSSMTLTQSSTLGAKIKMIPSNQFVQLKPPIQSQSKIYTIKTAAMLNNSLPGTALDNSNTASIGNGAIGVGKIISTAPTTTAQNKIYTFKNGSTATQFISASPTVQGITTNSTCTNYPKYTVVKTNLPISGSTQRSDDLSNIFDMPIIFADNDGNLTETVTTIASTSATTPPGQLIINPSGMKEATSTSTSSNTSSIAVPTRGSYIINNSTLQQTQKVKQPNKVVFINRNTMKPCPNIISRSNVGQLPKYTKVVVTNPKTSVPTLVARAPGAAQQSSSGVKIGSSGSLNTSAITSSVKQINIQGIKSPHVSGYSGKTAESGILNVGRSGITGNIKSLQQFQIINVENSEKKKVIKGPTYSPPGEQKPVQPTQLKNTIMLKPGGLKQIPAHLKTQLFNRNLTVRKLVNLVPAGKTSGVITTTVSQLQAGAALQQSSSSDAIKISKASIITDSPKNIKSNQTLPPNPETE